MMWILGCMMKKDMNLYMNIKDWIKGNIHEGSTIIEAGACEGIDTVFFSEIVGNGHVYSFEPIPDLYSQALININGRNNVELVNKALSDKNGKSKMYVSDRFGQSWGSSSILKPKDHLTNHKDITFKEEIEIDTINLDDWYKDKSINFVDLMWLDLQGYESVVLKSSPLILSKTRYLYTEVSLVELYEDGMIYEKYKSYLEENNFEVVFEEIYWVDGGNVLFKNKSI